MTRPTDPRTTAVVDAIRAAARYESDPDVIAARVVAALDEHDRRTHVETVAEAVRLVEDVIDAHLGVNGRPDVDTGTAVVEALIGRPVASITDDGVVSLAWPEGSAAAIVSRDVLDNLTERVNRAGAHEAELAARALVIRERDRELATAHAQIARMRRLGAAAEDAAVEGDLARLEALVVDRRPTVDAPDAYAHLDPLRDAVRNTIDRLEAELTSPGAVPLPDVELLAELGDAIAEDHAARPVADAAPGLTPAGPVVPCGDPEHCASHGECIDYADEVLDALGDAIARAHDARPLVEAAPALAALSPDCRAGKCTACTGDAWSDRLDAHTDCEHPCHAR